LFLSSQKAHLEKVVLDVQGEGRSAKQKLADQNREITTLKACVPPWHPIFSAALYRLNLHQQNEVVA
jgi:hypothetical protein